MSNAEDAIMLIRSVLCSQKNAISFKELNDDYYEMSGTRIPYKAIGFNTLQDFLWSHPDKFRVQQAGGDYTIAAVLDKQLVDLAKLVQGQKKTKKKKKAPQIKPMYKKPSPYNNYIFRSQKPMTHSPSYQFNSKRLLINQLLPVEHFAFRTNFRTSQLTKYVFDLIFFLNEAI